VEQGAISAERYDSYLRLREEMEDSERRGAARPTKKKL
jgi:putative ribosome biogenesis GTPase RsgA